MDIRIGNPRETFRIIYIHPSAKVVDDPFSIIDCNGLSVHPNCKVPCFPVWDRFDCLVLLARCLGL